MYAATMFFGFIGLVALLALVRNHFGIASAFATIGLTSITAIYT